MTSIPSELLQILQQELPKHTHKLQPALARDVWAVACGLRTATLLDTMSLTRAEVDRLAARFSSSEDATCLVVIHETKSEQTLIANGSLLKTLVASAFDFLEVTGREPVKVAEPPDHLGPLLAEILASTPASPVILQLKPNQDPQALIPLVGVLLGYPIIYSLGDGLPAPEGDASNPSGNCLGGIELTVIKFSWVVDESRHPLLSFSYPSHLYPSTLEDEPPAQRVQRILRERAADLSFGLRQDTGSMQAIGIDFEVRTGVKMDRVAL